MSQKIIIMVDGVKREFSPPFEICVSSAIAKALRVALRQADHDEFTYGWITVPAEADAVPGPPLKWRDQAK